jgi:hypothetical protein
MAELSLRRFQWFAHVTEPADPGEFRLCACRKQAAFVKISGSLIGSIVIAEEEGSV